MPVLSGGNVVQPGQLLFEEVIFEEAGAAGTYTGSVTVPAKSWLLDIKLFCQTAFGAGTSADMIVGDATDPNGWYDAIGLLVGDGDLVAGANAEVIDFNNAGGLGGAYHDSTTGERAEMYSAAERVVTGVITTDGVTSTAGEVRMLVIYTNVTTALEATYA